MRFFHRLGSEVYTDATLDWLPNATTKQIRFVCAVKQKFDVYYNRLDTKKLWPDGSNQWSSFYLQEKSIEILILFRLENIQMIFVHIHLKTKMLRSFNENVN